MSVATPAFSHRHAPQDAAQLLRGVGDEPVGLAGDGQVAGQGDDVRPEPGGQSGGHLLAGPLVATDDGDSGTVGRQRPGRGEADVPRASEDQVAVVADAEVHGQPTLVTASTASAATDLAQP